MTYAGFGKEEKEGQAGYGLYSAKRQGTSGGRGGKAPAVLDGAEGTLSTTPSITEFFDRLVPDPVDEQEPTRAQGWPGQDPMVPDASRHF